MGRIRFLFLVASLVLAALPASARSVRDPSQCDPVITVQRGDIFSVLIARHFGKQATWTQFTRFNQHIADPNLIVPGDEICVPKAEVLFGQRLPPAIERIVEIRVAARLGGQPAAAPQPAAATAQTRVAELERKNAALAARADAFEQQLRESQDALRRRMSQAPPVATPSLPPKHLDSALIAGSCATACATVEYPSTCLAQCNGYFTANQETDYTALLGLLFREIYDLKRASAEVPAVPAEERYPPLPVVLAIIFALAAVVLLIALVDSRNIAKRLRQTLTRLESVHGKTDDARDRAERRADKATADFEAVERAAADLTRGIKERDAKILRLSETEAGRTIERLDGEVAVLQADIEEAKEARADAERRALDAEARRVDIHEALQHHFGSDEAAADTIELFGDLAFALKAHAQLREALQFAARTPQEFLAKLNGALELHSPRMRLMALIRSRRGAISSETHRGVEIRRLEEWFALLDGHDPDASELNLAYRTIEEQAKTRLSDLVPDGDAARRHDRGEIKFLDEVLKALGVEKTVITRAPAPSSEEAAG